MSGIKSFDHVGITVNDLDAAVAFFTTLGLEVEGRTFLGGDFPAAVTGIPDPYCEIVMLHLPGGGGTKLEVCTFVRPANTPGSPTAMANEVGLRNICFEITGLQEKVDALAADGYGLVGVVGEYEDIWTMAYVRGPDGIVVSLAERLG